MATREEVLAELARRELARRQQAQPVERPGSSFVRTAAGTVGSLFSSAAGEVAGGLAGLAAGGIPFGGPLGLAAQRGRTPVSPGEPVQLQEQVRQALTTPMPPETVQALQSMAEQIPEPVRRLTARAAERFESFADLSAERFGPMAGAAVKTLPAFALEASGIGFGRAVLKASNRAQLASRKQLFRAMSEAAPTIDDLDDGAREIYRALDASDTRIAQPAMRDLLRRASAEGARTGGRTFESRALRELRELAQTPEGAQLSELLTARQIAQELIDPTNPTAASIAIRDLLDEAIDSLDVKSLTGSGRQSAGSQVRLARELYRRARRSEAIAEAMDTARRAASGLENGIRIEFGKLIRNKRKSRFFRPEELEAMKRVEQGGRAVNLFKTLGRLGIGEGRSTAMTASMLGAALGYAIGGPAGAVSVAGIGITSRRLAQRMTRGAAEAADRIIRAGRDGQAITQIYLQTVPEAQRSVRDLASLLVRPDVDLAGIPRNTFTAAAIQRARDARTSVAEAIAAAGRTAPALGALAPVVALPQAGMLAEE